MTKVKLEELYSIPHGGYTTGSEWVDGILIGIATWLLIRSSEFVVVDLLTFFYGNRKHRIGYRVLRIWQILNLRHFYKLFTGFDSDLPSTRFRRGQSEGVFDRKALSGLRIKKGRFKPILVLFVLLAKILVLAAEVAIIAFVIPVTTVHTSSGGLSLGWTNATVTESSLAELATCEQLLISDQFSDIPQLGLCKRVGANSNESAPQKWIPNGSLRFEKIDYTPENMRQAGAVPGSSSRACNVSDSASPSLRGRMYTKSMVRQRSFDPEPDAILNNLMSSGEIVVSGNSRLTGLGGLTKFGNAEAAIIPVFTDAKKMLRLSFFHLFKNRDPIDGKMKIVTLNGKLMIGDPTSYLLGSKTETVCPEAIDEIIRVTGTLHPEIIIDILRSGMTAVTAQNFTEPSQDSSNLRTKAGFQIGTSRKFRIPPEWMILAAGLAMLASAFTSRLNRTEASMARVYREHNNMYSACAPSYLEEELVVEGELFQNGNEYHWGQNPGKGWDQVSSTIDRAEEGTLV